MATMKALRLFKESSSSPVMRLVTVPKPTLTPGHLLIKVHASAIQPSDVLNAHGGFPMTTFPRIPGRDFAGVVVDGPADKIGMEVYGTSGYTLAFTEDGFHAEYTLVPENAVARKPKNLTWEQAAVVGVPFTTAVLVLARANMKASDKVLVIGGGGAVGSAVVQVAGQRGCKAMTAGRSDDQDINTVKDPSLSGAKALTNGKGFDVIVDTVGQPALTQAAVEALGQGGRLSFIAAPRTGSTEMTVDMKEMYREEKILVGCNSLKYSVEYMAAELAEMTASFEKEVLTASKDGAWTSVPLENAVEAYEKLAAKKTKEKFVIVM